MRKAWEILNYLLEIVVGCLFGVLILVVFAEVIGRYVLQIPMMWTEELARYLLILVTVLGIGKVSKTGDHLGVFFIRDRLKGRVKATVYIFNILVSILFTIVMIYATYRAYIQNYDTRGTLLLWFRVRWLYLAMDFGCVLMLVYFVRDLIYASKALLENVAIHADGYSSPFPVGYGKEMKAKEGAD